ncbi:PREDICTED: class I heat shock protein-like [Tarenaya hassleriana]|uniref:class I heat shock protein-like n=1 Tax=Tarenaya hassleriana TaxID=28532 RepID=UPI0008FD5BFF|nr:PREDICTED: class I heat shock protein-like [Tarenaya hassleriana]
MSLIPSIFGGRKTTVFDPLSILKISGERAKEKEEKNEMWHRVERTSGNFLRRFRLQENAKVDEVKASMENGVLTVTVPKVEDKEA